MDQEAADFSAFDVSVFGVVAVVVDDDVDDVMATLAVKPGAKYGISQRDVVNDKPGII